MPEVTPDSINSLGEKLQTFADGLSEQERAVLGYVLTRAEAAKSDAEIGGTAVAEANVPIATRESANLSTGLSSQLAQSVGLESTAAPSNLTVVWGW